MRVVEHPTARFRHTPGDYGVGAEWDLYRDTPAVTPEPRLVRLPMEYEELIFTKPQ